MFRLRHAARQQLSKTRRQQPSAKAAGPSQTMRRRRRLGLESCEERRLLAADLGLAGALSDAAAGAFVAGPAAPPAGQGNPALVGQLDATRNHAMLGETYRQAGAQMIDSAQAVDADPFIPQKISFNSSTGVVTVRGSDAMDQATVEYTSGIPSGIATYGGQSYHSARRAQPTFVGPLPPPGWQSGSAVTQDSANGAYDSARLSQAPLNNYIKVTWKDIITRETVTQSYERSRVTKVVFYGEDQQDVFTNLTDVPSEVYGGKDHDTITGGSGPDVLYGEGGEDVINGGNGADTLDGGGEVDTLDGGDGKDTLRGGKGDDLLIGGKGKDTLHGNEDDDTLQGNEGDDTLFGDLGADILQGGDDDDELHGGDGADDLRGGEDEDELLGEDGDDLLDGGADDDTLEGGDHRDRLYGGGGDDELLGGEDIDSLWGGDGDDDLTGGFGADRYFMHDVLDDHDSIATKTDDDVEVHLENLDSQRHDGHEYTAGHWIFAEVAEVDEALAQLVDRVGDNTLLRTKGGKELTLRRLGTPQDVAEDESVAWAWNLDNTGKITITDFAFFAWNDDNDPDSEFGGGDFRTSFDDEVHNVVIHEIGHNWDDENPEWGDWKDLSGWQDILWVSWHHDDDANFASDYAESHPREDFAETFAAYFAFENGEEFHRDEPSAVNSSSSIPGKINFMDDFLDDLT